MEHGGSSATGNTDIKVGEFLHRERLARNITLDVVEARTKISRHLLEDLEDNNLRSWPRERFYRENFLRAYAAAIGLDARHVIDRFRREFPLADPLPTPVPQARRPRPTWLMISASAAAAFIIGFVAIYRQMGEQSSEAPTSEPVGAATAGVETNPNGPADVAKSAAVKPEPLSPAPVPPAEPVVTDVPEETGNIEGELVISSTPPGAHVTVNGIGRGRTPLRVQFLPAGTYTIRFVESGHQMEQRRVTITRDRRSHSVSATLRPTAEPVAAE